MDQVCPSTLDRPVLVLNRSWQPVHTCGVRRALHLLCLGHAQVVQVEGEEKFTTHDLSSWLMYSSPIGDAPAVRSVRMTMRVPNVMVLSDYDKIPRLEVRFTRRNVFLRDHFTCQYCVQIFPEEQLNLDHVLPRAKGGRTSWENIVTSCFRCNTRKANKLPQEANMHPISKPKAPRWQPLFGLQSRGGFDETWQFFLNGSRSRLSA